MAQDLSVASRKRLQAGLKNFTNLLKEFPASGDDTFVYDASTLAKIAKARSSLAEMNAFVQEKKSIFRDEQRRALQGWLDILTRLMEELPRDAAAEFLYGPDIHQLVADSREALISLDRMISGS